MSGIVRKDLYKRARILRQIRTQGLGSVFEEFETLDQAKARRKANIVALRESRNEDAQVLATRLSRCGRGGRCESGACPVCNRRYRKNVIYQTIHALLGLDNLLLVTWQCSSDDIPNDKLPEFDGLDLLRIKNRNFQKFKRLNVEYPIIGSFEMAYLPEKDSWRPHFHAVTSCGNRDVLEHFRVYLQKQKHPRNTAPLHIIPITKTPVAAIGYLFKSEWKQKPSRVLGLRYTTQRLVGERLVNALLALDRLGMRKKLFLHKCKSYRRGRHLIFVA